MLTYKKKELPSELINIISDYYIDPKSILYMKRNIINELEDLFFFIKLESINPSVRLTNMVKFYGIHKMYLFWKMSNNFGFNGFSSLNKNYKSIDLYKLAFTVY